MKKILFIVLIAIVIAILPLFLGTTWLITVGLYCLATTLLIGVIYLHEPPKKKVVKQNYLYYSPEEHSYLHE